MMRSRATTVCQSTSTSSFGNGARTLTLVSRRRDMGLPQQIDHFIKRPTMYVPSLDFDAVAGFFQGFDVATYGGLLTGFREWLIVRLGYANNLAWTQLVLRLAFPDAESPRQKLLQDDG